MIETTTIPATMNFEEKNKRKIQTKFCVENKVALSLHRTFKNQNDQLTPFALYLYNLQLNRLQIILIHIYCNARNGQVI